MLHVFWEAPDIDAATKILDALNRCATATHRDTPCVPMYFFHRSVLDADLEGTAPETVGEHPQLNEAHKKLQVGVPRPAVIADLVRRGIDPQLLDDEPDTKLPESMRNKPSVMLEFTELYLDQRSFYEHAGSRDYLNAYGEVMMPGLQQRQVTVRLGTPTAEIEEKILKPMLKERVQPIQAPCKLWTKPEATCGSGILLALDVSGDADQVTFSLPPKLCDESTTCVVLPHPFREGRVRVLCVLQNMPDKNILEGLAALQLNGIEAHCEESNQEQLQEILKSASLDHITTTTTNHCGYLIHSQAYGLEKM